jgi:hypothetical protein
MVYSTSNQPIDSPFTNSNIEYQFEFDEDLDELISVHLKEYFPMQRHPSQGCVSQGHTPLGYSYPLQGPQQHQTSAPSLGATRPIDIPRTPTRDLPQLGYTSSPYPSSPGIPSSYFGSPAISQSSMSVESARALENHPWEAFQRHSALTMPYTRPGFPVANTASAPAPQAHYASPPGYLILQAESTSAPLPTGIPVAPPMGRSRRPIQRSQSDR